MISHRGIQVFVLIALYLLLASHLPEWVHRGLYTVSLGIKDILVWILPITVGLFIAHTIASFERKAPLFILTLILFEAISNFSSVWYAFAGGRLATDFLPPVALPTASGEFLPLWRFSLVKPSFWSADKGTLVGVLLGFLSMWTKRRTWIERGKERVEWILTRIFSRLIPLFVLGFVARMHQTKLLHHVFAHYGVLLAWLVALLVTYIALLFLVGSGRGWIQSIKNLLPAGGLALTSGCSLSTMPWTIEGAGKNLEDPEFARAVIPATTNIQQIGDCIANCFLCFLLYYQFQGCSPDLWTWAQFSVVFVLARFATAAILGGAIFIMLPIYETYLSFNPEMIAIILAFNVILDPLITSSNVMANGALCRIYERVWLNFQKKPIRIRR
ncbi:MAG: cation:dicarboxylase symporter family transporter [Verrucomicrobia bacterium]|nr:cation:dicarboxylase symporter family transporter [Verrucomicrobiota bacterium]